MGCGWSARIGGIWCGFNLGGGGGGAGPGRVSVGVVSPGELWRKPTHHVSSVYDTIDGVKVRIARSARKHRIGNAHILAALAGARVVAEVGDQVVYVGVDDRGLELD